jgi:hypothetical protein
VTGRGGVSTTATSRWSANVSRLTLELGEDLPRMLCFGDGSRRIVAPLRTVDLPDSGEISPLSAETPRGSLPAQKSPAIHEPQFGTPVGPVIAAEPFLR